ncbi:MAG: arginine--tRNA ligase, partial [Treponema porcinum]|nr:arginine--tRNA ligase [Treponema porcinum]
MSDVKSEYRRIVAEALNKFINEKNAGCAPVNADTVAVQTPPNPEMGDLGIPMFVYAKTLRAAPVQIASEIVRIINETYSKEELSRTGEFLAVGPYVNLKLNKADAGSAILERIAQQKDS